MHLLEWTNQGSLRQKFKGLQSVAEQAESPTDEVRSKTLTLWHQQLVIYRLLSILYVF